MSWGRVVFLILGLGLSAFAFFEYKKNQSAQEDKRIESLLFKDELKLDELQEFILEKSSQVHLKLVQEDIGWMLVQPLKDQASDEKVNDLITNILNQKIEYISDVVEDWAEYDLDEPSLVVKLKDKHNKVWSVEISGQPNFDQKYFIKKDNQLFLGSSDWKKISLSWSDEYQSKKLYSLRKKPTSFSFQAQGKNYNFSYENQRWKSNASFPISSVAVEKFLDLFKQDIIQNVADEKRGFKKWSRPDLKLKFMFEKDEKLSWSLDLKKMKGGHAQVITSDRDFVFDIDKNHTDKILQFDFRDHRVPFRWDLRKLSQIEVQSADINFIVKNTSSKEDRKDKSFPWEVVEPVQHQLNKDDFNSFLDWLGELEAKNYHRKSMKDKVARIILKDVDDKIMFQMDLSMEVNKDKPDALERVYVQVNSQGPSMDIDLSSFQQVFKESIIEKIESDE